MPNLFIYYPFAPKMEQWKELKAQGRPNLANGISLYVTDDLQG